MKKRVKNKLSFSFLFPMLLIFCIFANAYVSEDELNLPYNEIISFDNNENVISVTVSSGLYKIKNCGEGQEIIIENYGRLLVPGKPNLPSKIFSMAIPPGAEIAEISFDTVEGILLNNTYKILPASFPKIAGQENTIDNEKYKKMYKQNFDLIYKSDDPYPSSMVEFIRNASYRKYNLVDIRVTPFTYRPLSGRLIYFPNITVYLTYHLKEQTCEVVVDNLVRTERIANEIIANYDQASKWYPSNTVMQKGVSDFVIVTLDSLTSSVMPLVNWELSKGRTVKVVNISWINTNYEGYDLTEKIRNFLRDKYLSSEWGIEDVLLVGHYDDVPIRRTWQDIDFGKPETDFYYAELSLPDYRSWDADGDNRYGEDSDPIDFYSEVNVGRIPWSEPDIVLSICEKSVAYEQNNNPSYKKNMLLLGAFFWNDTDNAAVMEQIVNQPWMSDWTMTKMYEKNADYWSSYDCDYPLLHSNVMSIWPNGKYGFVNWAGHGMSTSAHIFGLDGSSFISSFDCPLLNDEYPAIILANACSNSDIDYSNNIGQTMLKKGAVGFIGPTKISFFCNDWWHPNDGSSQSFDYFFSTCITSGNYTLGEAHQWALKEMYIKGLWYSERYEMFEWGTLFGNPNLGMNAIGDFPFFEIDEINGGLGITSVIRNIGNADTTNVQCKIMINNGLNIVTKEASYILPSLAVGESAEISMPVLGFGLGIFTHFPTITITAGVPNANTAEKTITAKIIGPFVIPQ